MWGQTLQNATRKLRVVHMRKNRVIEQNRCYYLVSRLAHRAFFLDDEEKVRAVALMRRVEAGRQEYKIA